METLSEALRIFYLDLTAQQQSQIVSTAIVLLLIVVLRFIGMRIVHRRYQTNSRALYNGRKTVQYTAIGLAVLLVGRIWLIGVQALFTYLGLVSAGIAIALQDPIVNLAGWLFIVSRRPFVMGDRVEIGGMLGDVIDIRPFQFSMLEVGAGRVNSEQSTGRIIHVPNGEVFRESVINTHQGLPYIWNEINVTVTFESDWRKAKSLLVDIVDRLAPDVTQAAQQYLRRVEKRFVINYDNVKPVVYTAVGDSGVQLTLRYMVDPRRRRGSEQTLWEAILAAFEKYNTIDFAYPTQREFIHHMEGKHLRPKDDIDAPTIVARPVEWSQSREKK
ncbi:MAG: mechanosensitive ion channel family protein [Chloroflexota bacterium]